jgi:hypothetical protein
LSKKDFLAAHRGLRWHAEAASAKKIPLPEAGG